MATQINKSGAELNIGWKKNASPDNDYVWDSTNLEWDTRFEMDDGVGTGDNHLRYDLGMAYAQTDDFWFKIRMKMPSDYTGVGDPNDWRRGKWGLFNVGGTGGVGTFLGVYLDANGAPLGTPRWRVGAQGGTSAWSNFNNDLVAGTVYDFEFSHNTSTDVLTLTVKETDGTVFDTVTVSTAGKTISLSSIGCHTSRSYDGARYDKWFSLQGVRCNSGLIEEWDGKPGLATGVVQLRQPNTSDYTDISTKTESIKIEREFNAVDIATINLFNALDTNLALLTPNSRIRVKLGFGQSSSHFTFFGYIPPHPDYCNACSIKGKNRTFRRENDIILYGIAHKVIPPASADYEDVDEKAESSEQEDMFKAQRYCEVNNNPEFPFSISPEIISVIAYAYTNKLEAELFRFDEIDNLDNMGCFAATDLLHKKLSESDLTFAGGSFDPKKYLGDTKGDWRSGLDFLNDMIMSRLEKDDSLPAKPRRYYWSQSNHGAPQTTITEYPDLEDRPSIIKTVAETEILEIRRSSGKYAVDFIDGLWIDLGDIIYLDTDEYSLKGYYAVAKIDYLWSVDTVNITVYLDKPARVK